jgi:hypothetical protein
MNEDETIGTVDPQADADIINETGSQIEPAPVEELNIPEDWEAPLKEFITGIEDKGAQKAFFDKFVNFDSGYKKKFEDVANQRKEVDELRKSFDGDKALFDGYRSFENSIDQSHKAEILGRYGSVQNYMSALHQMDIAASSNPAQFLINYCNNLGITRENLEHVLSGSAYQEARQQHSNKNFESEILNKVRQEFEEREAQKEVQAFYAAKDASGNAMYPHFETLREEMSHLSDVYPNDNLPQLYEKALYLNPELREAEISNKAKTISGSALAAKARAASPARPAVPAPNVSQKQNWRDTLDDFYRQS